MSDYEIEKGVAKPKAMLEGRSSFKRQYKQYPWWEMAVGDSFFIEAKTEKRQRDIGRQVNHRNRTNEENGIPQRYSYFIYPNGVRVWRDEDALL